MPGELRLKALAFSDSVIKRIETSRASSTRQTLLISVGIVPGMDKKETESNWMLRCHLLTSFMDYLFKERKIRVQTILNYKSAIAFYWKSQVGYEIPESDTINFRPY